MKQPKASPLRKKMRFLILPAAVLLAFVVAALSISTYICASVEDQNITIDEAAKIDADAILVLGARVWDILRLVLGQGLGTVAAGAAAGLAGALALVRLLQSRIAGLGAANPLTLASVLLLLMAVAFLACLVPALGAVRVDPTRTLRSE